MRLFEKIFVDETVDALKYQKYVRGRLGNAMCIRGFGLQDNAAINRTIESIAAKEEVFEGNFMFSVPYCFMDKPCELGFANIKNDLKAH